MIKSLLYFVAAGLCEIGGGYLVWLWLRENKPIWFAVVGCVILILYRVIPTFQPANFGRVCEMTAIAFETPSGFAFGSVYRRGASYSIST